MKLYKIWVGTSPPPEIFRQYTDTWELSGCEIVEVDNTWINTCLMDTNSRMLKWAIDNYKWPLINHYIRYWILYKYGGVYADLDVQFVKPVPFVGVGCWIGMESERWINNCVMVTSVYHPFFQDCMDFMDNMDFSTPEIELETGPRLVTNLIEKYTTFKHKNLSDPVKVDYKLHPVTVLPCRFFSPHRWNQVFDPAEIVEDTITVHHYCHSWK
jgi:mannosyltransferase OCH1-like enzyme